MMFGLVICYFGSIGIRLFFCMVGLRVIDICWMMLLLVCVVVIGVVGGCWIGWF